jgi:hypothetical protein
MLRKSEFVKSRLGMANCSEFDEVGICDDLVALFGRFRNEAGLRASGRDRCFHIH